ncbi:type II toxin-antitoxin system HicB family antitoxin [Oscillatoria sp. FACHB-1407]|uniref:type II toxin-antitoxin system HicB family antitoxin n=1 Tax=Oscillatoria sp. FACHB-1407 TaxID=2692847 RepID=UPI001689D05B|nr:type II toxin-antitoxin system HicB family antitoxin [Oscillatoria sp. FACHB-1407]MBD2465064.1 type II toxin-antitoxin system HicB family antitoxin [Oscillatoria sp. FACHB-1407]
MLTYQGYTSDIKIDVESKTLHGQILGIKDVVTFEGDTVEKLEKEFHKSVDAYIKFCAEIGQKPDKPFSGKLPFRTTPEVHRAIYLAAAKTKKSINSWMEDVLKQAAEKTLSS